MNKIPIDITRAITPNLFGIDCRIVYAKRKCNSGWICTGVTRGFASTVLIWQIIVLRPTGGLSLFLVYHYLNLCL